MAIALLLGIMPIAAWAQSFADHFNRADTGLTTTGSVIGSGYIIGTPLLSGNSGIASWQISGQALVATPGSNRHNTIVNSNVQTANGVGNGFVVSCDMSNPGNGFMGFALNYQTASDYYALRILPASSSIELCNVHTEIAQYSDSFDRADAGPTTTGSVIGTGYIISTPALPGNSGTATWAISSNKLTIPAPGSNQHNTIINQTNKTTSGPMGGTNLNFTVSAEMSTPNTGWMGLAFNYQDMDNYYALRIQPTSSKIQLIYVKKVGGVVSTGLIKSETLDIERTTIQAGLFVVGQSYSIRAAGTTNFTAIGAANNTVGTVFTATGVGSGTGTAATPLVVQQNRNYFLRVRSGTPGTFTYTLIDTTDNTTVSGTLIDSSVLFSDGFGGFYAASAIVTYENLSIPAATITTDTIASTTLTNLAGSNMTVATNRIYNLNVTSGSPGVFKYILTDKTNAETAAGTITDSAGRFKEGYSGLYADTTQVSFDNYAVATQKSAFADHLNRANTGTTTVGSVIGSDYFISTPALSGNSGTAAWEISNGELIFPSPGGNTNNTIINESVITHSGGGAGFTVAANMKSASNSYMGLTLNYLDANNFYAIRIQPTSSSIELIYVQDVGGTVSTGVIASATLTKPAGTTMTVATNTVYTIDVTSSAAGVFSYVLTNGNETAKGTLTDSSARFSVGCGGLYASLASATFDNPSISTVNTTVTDDFNRADTGLTTSGSLIGTSYIVSTPALSTNSGTGPWQILNGVLTITPTSTTSSSTMVFYSAATSAVSSGTFTVTGNLTPTGASWSGLTLNYQNPNNFYAIRVCAGTDKLQLIYLQQSGSATSLTLAQSVTLPFTIPGSALTTMTVSSSSAGVFNYTVSSGANSTSGTLTDSGQRFSGGYAGYYASSAVQAKFGLLSMITSRPLVSIQYLTGDPTFQAGSTVNNVYAVPPTTAGLLQWTTANGSPVWKMAEWGNRVSIVTAGSGVLQGDGSYLWQVPYTAPSGNYYSLCKSFNLAPTGSSAASSYDLMMSVNSRADYDDVFRVSNLRWPAVYFVEAIGPAGGTLNSAQPKLADLKSLQLSLNAAIPSQYNNTGTDRLGNSYDPTKHLSHLFLFITVQNLNRTSPGYGDYLWFGFQIYHSQNISTLATLVDTVTGKYTYAMAMNTLLPEMVGANGSTASVNITGDILPLIKEALRSAWAAGSLPDSHDFSDYQLATYQVGWEVPGLATVQASIKNQSLIGTY